ncbi:hypothetical protein [Lederbergia ruris]|uniref:hypothetical protein n=1 Tax=Lederbergia ruris TaxID=217495 RepID=UPI0039A1B183
MKDHQKRGSKLELDLRKSGSSSKTSIQSRVGCKKSRRIIKNVDPSWGWVDEKVEVRRKRRSKVGLDVRKVEGSSKTWIQAGVGSTKK